MDLCVCSTVFGGPSDCLGKWALRGSSGQLPVAVAVGVRAVSYLGGDGLPSARAGVSDALMH